MLPRGHRLVRPEDFSSVFSSGVRAGGPLLVAHVRPGTQTHATRVGFVVSKAVGNAVVRNRVKRRLRALMASRLEVLSGSDLVIRALPAAAQADFDALGAALDSSLRRALRKVSR